MRTRIESLAIVAVVTAGALLPGTVWAQPNSNLSDYALFAQTQFRTKGLTLSCGSVGVNQAGGKLVAPRYMTVPEQVVADFVKIGDDGVVGEVFANLVLKSPVAPSPWTPPILPNLEAACGFPAPFPVCDQNADVLVFKDTTETLGPGVYGDLTLKGGFSDLGSPAGAILELTGGEYTFCNVKLNKFAEVRALAPVTVNVSGNLRMQATNEWGAADGSGVLPSEIVVYVAGSKVHYSRASEVDATLCAPLAKCRLTKAGAHSGRVACNKVRTEQITFDCGFPSGAFLD